MHHRTARTAERGWWKMTRLIDGNALVELINGGYDLDFDEVPETKRELLRMIMEQPTVDAVPVIRCKDCKYYSCGTVEGKHLCMSVKYRFTPTAEDDWCSRAERKEE